jgi:hypothetical protein
MVSQSKFKFNKHTMKANPIISPHNSYKYALLLLLYHNMKPNILNSSICPVSVINLEAKATEHRLLWENLLGS